MQDPIEANKALVLRFWEEVWNQGKLELVDEFCHPPVNHGQRSAVTGMLAGFSDSRITVEAVIAEDDLVVTRYKWEAVHTGVWEGSLAGLSAAVPPTGSVGSGDYDISHRRWQDRGTVD
jgi:predicted ester cyclase